MNNIFKIWFKPDQLIHYSSTALMHYFISFEKIIFNLSEDNILESTRATIDQINNDYVSSCSSLILSRLIYSSILSQMKDINLYINFMKQIEIKEQEITKSNYELINKFRDFLLDINSQESYFILEKMIGMNLVSLNLVENKRTYYFAHHFPNKLPNDINKQYYMWNYHKEVYEKLSNNDFEHHKKSVEEGHNPNKILKVIRNDEIEKLQEISSQNDFDFNQYVEPSLYERCDFINQKNVTLIDYAAFFGSVKCFKYLLMNDADVSNTGKYAVAGGNEEIIHLCEQNHSSFEDAYEAAIEYHRNDIFHYIYENKISETKNLGERIIKLFLTGKFINYEILNFYLNKK